MPRHRVIGTRKGFAWPQGDHRHVTDLGLATGMISKDTAIIRIRTGFESYYPEAAGLVAEVEVGDRCPRCGCDYLRTDHDQTPANNLLNLPDC